MGDPDLWPGAGFGPDDGVDVFLRATARVASGNGCQATVRVRLDRAAESMPYFFSIALLLADCDRRVLIIAGREDIA